MGCSRYLIALLLVLFLVFIVSSSSFTAAQEETGLEDIIRAQNALMGCFDATKAAEAAGADVTNLLTRLNKACDLLAQAENAFRSGDFNLASSKAKAAVPIAEKVSSDARNLESVALVNAKNTFWLTTTFSITSLAVFIFILFFVWRRFKRNYIKNLSSKKPELTENED